MTPCAGLIPCTPEPSLPLTGLTASEAVAFGTMLGNVIGVTAIVLLLCVMLLITVTAWAAMR